jgi:hypothetical protein
MDQCFRDADFSSASTGAGLTEISAVEAFIATVRIQKLLVALAETLQPLPRSN